MTTILRIKKHVALFLSMILLVFAVSLSGFMWNEKNITVSVDGQNRVIKTHQTTAYGAIREAGISMNDKDSYTLTTKELEEGTVITVIRAFPVAVTMNGETKTVMTTAMTAQALANELGYKQPSYEVVGDSKEVLKKGASISIAKVTQRVTQTVTKQVDIQTVREPDDKMVRGEQELVQSGTPGMATVKEEVIYENGKAVKTNVIESTETVKMVPRIVKEGTRENTVSTSRGVMRYARVITMHASAYIATDGNGDGITATGIPATRGVVAVDPDVIPLGTRLFIPGYGMAIAADTGGAIVGNRIDLVMDSYGEAMNFGRQSVDVYVLQ